MMTRIEFMAELAERLKDLPEMDRQDALQYYEEYFDDAGLENEQAVVTELKSPAAVAARLCGQYGYQSPNPGYQSASTAAQNTAPETPSAKAETPSASAAFQSVQADAPHTEPGGQSANTGFQNPESGFQSANTGYQHTDPGYQSAGQGGYAGARSWQADGATYKNSSRSSSFWIWLICLSPFWAPLLLGVAMTVLMLYFALIMLIFALGLAVLALALSCILCLGVGTWQIFTDPLNGAFILSMGLTTAGLGLMLTPAVISAFRNAIPCLNRGLGGLWKRLTDFFRR